MEREPTHPSGPPEPGEAASPLRAPAGSPSGGLIRAGDLLGRYLIVDRLGAGGMGTVFAAYDRELDRKVALKVLQEDAAADQAAQQRLVREAQAMAKLDHPNVVTVFDVGLHGHRVFVAMEFVGGVTLRAWQQTERAWTEIVDAYRQAARGIEAAHEAGLVHRDFKPDNAMVDATGRVRVMDFGLVRAEGQLVTEVPAVEEGRILEPGAEADARVADDAMARIRGRLQALGQLGASTTVGATQPVAAEEGTPAGTGPGALAAELTRPGMVMGTLAYMSPEQLQGVRADARADQFSFCVALFEALFGERPFGKGTPLAILERMRAGDFAAVPRDTPVPAPLVEALRRGLSFSPEDRFASMGRLEDALAEVVRPKPLRMAWPVGTTLALVIGASAWAYGHREAPCRGADAAAATVWSPARQVRVSDAFATTGASFAADAGERVVRSISDYVEAWSAMRREACEATEVRREQSSTMLDRRMLCLDDRLREVDALASVFESADLSVVEHGPEAARRLTPLSACADGERLLAEVPAPADPETAAKVRDLDARLVEVRAEVAGGHFERAVTIGQAVAEEAGATGYGPVVARANLELGIALDYDGRHDAAQVALRQAALEGRASRQDDVAADAEARLVFVAGVRRQKFERGRWWAEHARAAARRARRPEAQMAIDNNLGALLVAARESEQGIEHLERALAERRELLGEDHPDTLESLNNVAVALRTAGRFDASRSQFEALVALRTSLMGPEHPAVAAARGGLAATLVAQGEYGAARAVLDEVLVTQTAAYGREHPDVVSTLISRGYAALQAGELASAADDLEEAATLAVRVHGAEHPATLRARFDLAQVYAERGDIADAITLLREVLAGRIAALGEQHPAVERTRALLAEYEERRSQPRGRELRDPE